MGGGGVPPALPPFTHPQARALLSARGKRPASWGFSTRMGKPPLQHLPAPVRSGKAMTSSLSPCLKWDAAIGTSTTPLSPPHPPPKKPQSTAKLTRVYCFTSRPQPYKTRGLKAPRTKGHGGSSRGLEVTSRGTWGEPRHVTAPPWHRGQGTELHMGQAGGVPRIVRH